MFSFFTYTIKIPSCEGVFYGKKNLLWIICIKGV